MNRFPRFSLKFLPTPLVELKRLSRHLNGPRLFIKRDDLTGLALGGNKTRKLEYLIGAALNEGCDTVITGGAMQSNHCRQTAAAAAAAGLECHLALGGDAPAVPEGNLLLDYLFGATIHWCGEQRKGEQIPFLAGQLRSAGHKPYIIPYGGSNTTGAIGFAMAAGELQEQLSKLKCTMDHIVIPTSSGGTQAGLVAGTGIYNLSVQIMGIAIDHGKTDAALFESGMAALANEVAAQWGRTSHYTAEHFRVNYGYSAAGYGVAGALEKEAIKLAARLEGILLDPVYTGRAMGGLIDLIHGREFSAGESVLFWHTGGTPALFKYNAELL